MSTKPNGDLSSLVEAIVSSYRAEPRTRHIDTGILPNHEAVIEALGMLRELLFPGYFGRQNLASASLVYHVGDLVFAIRENLQRQLRNAIVHHCTRNCEPVDQVEEQALAITDDFLATIPQLRAMLATDAEAAFQGDPAAGHIDEIIFCYPGFMAVTIFRIAHELHVRGVPLIPRIMTEHAHSITGIDIHPGATIGEYFFIDHGTGVVIGETTVIGKRVKIYQGVTLGALSTRGGQRLRGVQRHPTLEDEVTVYSGASILGGDTVVGTGAVISSNVFVTKSVPPHTRVTVKNPELQYRDQKPAEFKQDLPGDWVI